MPRVLGLFGHPLPRMGTKRLPLIITGVLVFILFSIFIAVPPDVLPNAVPSGDKALTTGDSNTPATSDHKFGLPGVPNLHDVSNALNPFKAPAHAPPRQKNDSDGESSWWADWKWLVPFSSSLTLDDDRSLLPPLKTRPPIYCYYDHTAKKDAATKDAESALLLTWRRAWWAKGFLPVILSDAEATNNPQYEHLQRLQMDEDIKMQLLRWMAWESMGGGILAHYTLLPMGRAQDPLLVYLRRGEYPMMTRYSGLDAGLLVGAQTELAKAIKAVLDSNQLSDTKDIFRVVPGDVFTTDKTPKAVAYYDSITIETKYPSINKAMQDSAPEGLKKLNELINAHLHQTWQNVFSSGIAVLQPAPEHTSLLVTNAVSIANDLVTCSPSPLADGSCPPNLPHCSPCSDKNRMKMATPESFVNSSSLYTIGTVPHPYTFASLSHVKDHMDVPWLLKELQERDPWLTKITQKLFDEPASRSAMLMRFKEAVAGEFAPSHSLWLSAEKDAPADLNWHFGFSIPHAKTKTLKNAKSDSPELLHDGWDNTKSSMSDKKAEKRADDLDPPFGHLSKGASAAETKKATEDAKKAIAEKKAAVEAAKEDEEKGDEVIDWPTKEAALLNKALAIKTSTDANDVKMRNALEAWDVADMEAWKFARAFLARRIVERKNWEAEESQYAQGAGTEEGRRTRWWDNIEDKISDKISSVSASKTEAKAKEGDSKDEGAKKEATTPKKEEAQKDEARKDGKN